MNKYLNVLHVLVIALGMGMVATFSSCGEDDEQRTNELIKYKWYSEDMDYLLYGSSDLNLSVQTDKVWLYFLSDGTGIMSCKATDRDTYFGTSRTEVAYYFKYSVSDNKIHLSFKNKGMNRTLTYNKDYLVDINSDTSYKALSFTSSELSHAKELADEQEFQALIDHTKIQPLDVVIGFSNIFQPIKYSTYYDWYFSSCCKMPKDSYRRGITSAGLVLYVDNGTIVNKTGYDKNTQCTVSVTTLDGKKAYYFEHVIYYDEETDCGSTISVESSSGTSLTIHRAYRYYDSVSKKYFTSPSKEYIHKGEGIVVK